jgi:hypothetical protein
MDWNMWLYTLRDVAKRNRISEDTMKDYLMTFLHNDILRRVSEIDDRIIHHRVKSFGEAVQQCLFALQLHRTYSDITAARVEFSKFYQTQGEKASDFALKFLKLYNLTKLRKPDNELSRIFYYRLTPALQEAVRPFFATTCDKWDKFVTMCVSMDDQMKRIPPQDPNTDFSVMDVSEFLNCPANIRSFSGDILLFLVGLSMFINPHH